MLLQVEGLKTHLGDGDATVKAVDDVSLTLAHGETVCLVGESGSGKSMMALSIMRLTPPDISRHPAGAIRFAWRHYDGRTEEVDILKLPPERLTALRGSRIAMIFQEPMTSLNPVFTVGEQIIEAVQLHRPDVDDDQARILTLRALEQVHIDRPGERFDEYPHRLSGGQRQRVMIAMALACESEMLIADEPTTALDVTVQAGILRLMQDLKTRNNTGILFITHDLAVAAQMADRIAVMYRGRIVETGGVDQIIRQPRHEYTQRLIAALPENLKTAESGARPLIAEASPLLEARGLKVHFPVRRGLLRKTQDYIRAVDGVDLALYPGTATALVGESGCGKSTLGSALLRLVDATAGQLLYRGRDYTGYSRKQMQPIRRELQVVFQDPGSSLNPRLSIETSLIEPMQVHRVAGTRAECLAIARRVLRQVGLEPSVLSRYPHEFSGGQRQRLSIARALVLSPRLLVCDEITSALDVSVQAEILRMLKRLSEEQGLTLLFISHDISVVEYLCRHTAVMYDGRIVEYGPTERVCRQPEHDYTRKLLSAVPRIDAA